MRILITGKNEFSGADLEVGRYYACELALEGTSEQNNTFHALLEQLWLSGLHTYDVSSKDDLKKKIKEDYGAGYENYYYIKVTEKGRLVNRVVKSLSDVTGKVAIDENGQKMLYGKELISWGDYSKKQRTETISRLITLMDYLGVCSRKYFEIRDTMEKNSMEGKV